MTYNLVKSSIPTLVDKQLAMKIAKMNNIDYNTGKLLPEPPKPPTQFELLCVDIKESFFAFVRANILFIIMILLLIIFLIYRYYQVKKRKADEAENEQKIKKILEQNILEQKISEQKILEQNQNNFLKENDIDKKKQELEMELLRTNFNNYNDTNIKKLIMANRLNNNMYYYDNF
jgi:hypothetical protein